MRTSFARSFGHRFADHEVKRRLNSCYSSREVLDHSIRSYVDSVLVVDVLQHPYNRHSFRHSTRCRKLSTSAEVIISQQQKQQPVIRQRAGVLNLSILAHVDHGKTTLVDQLLRAASSSQDRRNDTTTDRLLDCGDLEKERGITITSKVTRIDDYKNYILNIVDTPGHADFCGEVDRVLSLVDGAVLVVDALEGPMVQTKYVLSRALSMNIKPVVVLNKVDRRDGWVRAVTGETESEILDLFDSLGASDDQMDYLTLYASAKQGWVTDKMEIASKLVYGESFDKEQDPVDMTVMLDHLLRTIPPPRVESYFANDGSSLLPADSFVKDPFSLAAVTVGYDAYLGRTCTGRITSGSVSINDEVVVLRRDEGQVDSSKLSTASADTVRSTLNGIFVNRGISRVALESGTAFAGDIVTLTGVPDSIRVGDTLTGVTEENSVVLPIVTPPLVPPTLSMEFGANDSPFAGTEGTEVTPTKLRNRLKAETDNNVTLTVDTSPSDSEKTSVYARGELQLGILIEQMRREGFEMVISPPKIVTKMDDDGKTLLEPFEEVTVDVDSEYTGYIVSALTGDRKGFLFEMNEDPNGKARLRFEVPSRGLLGFPSEAAAVTRGSAVVNHVYLEDRKHVGALGDGLEKGKLISSESGKATHYALASLAARGVLFVEPGDIVYPGMVIGENAKQGDMEVNPVRAKAATNMRTQAKDEKTYLPPPKRMSIEELIGYMAPDEMIEVTPTALRLRKASLDPTERRVASRIKKQQQDALKQKKNKNLKE